MSISILGSMRLPSRHRPTADVAITCGHLDDRGVPIDKGAFFLMTPLACGEVTRGGQKGSKRLPSPVFKTWNFSADGQRWTGRPIVTGRLTHASIDDALHVMRMAYSCPTAWTAPKTPGNAPFCMSSAPGEAKRWDGKSFRPFKCHGEDCPEANGGLVYRGEEKSLCGPKLTLSFLLDVGEDRPQARAFFESGGWNTTAHFDAWVRETTAEWDAHAHTHGITMPMWWEGLPIRLQVGEVHKKRQAGAWGVWPEVTITTAIGMSEWFDGLIRRREETRGRLRALSEPVPTAAALEEGYRADGVAQATGGRLLTDGPAVLEGT